MMQICPSARHPGPLCKQMPQVVAGAAQRIEAAGGEVVGEEYVPLGTQDFSSVAQKSAGSGADLIFPALVGGDAIAFEAQAVDFGIG